MKRRLSALRIKDEKNNKKAEVAHKKIKYHQFIQALEQQERDRKEIFRQEVGNRIEKQRNLNSAERSHRKSKLVEVRKELQGSKLNSYHLEKKTSKEIQARIK